MNVQPGMENHMVCKTLFLAFSVVLVPVVAALLARVLTVFQGYRKQSERMNWPVAALSLTFESVSSR